MAWQSEYAEKYFKAWNVQSRLAWDVPYNTHTYLVEGYLCEGFTSLRNQILGRYSKFISKLLKSPSKEIVFMINLILRDARSVTNANIRYLNQKSGLDILKTACWKVKSCLPVKLVPRKEMYRIGWLNILLEAKFMKNFSSLNLNRTQCIDMIKSLCIT